MSPERISFIAKEAKKELARRSMVDFALYTDENYKMNWHHRLMCKYLDRWVSRDIKRLMVFMPPRHGKSELVSRKLPAFIFGKNPDARIIGTSYSADLATAMNRDVQRIIDSDKYHELFPRTFLNSKNIRSTVTGSALRNADKFEIVAHRGMYRSAGVDGGITGMGGDYIIIDDPVKNRQDANSPTMRKKVFDWYTSTLYTRLEKDGCILLTLTRWHEDDLAGKLLAAMQSNPDADKWEILCLPAVYEEKTARPYDVRTEEGQALWPWKYDEKALRTMRATMGGFEWAALYQQKPQPAEGSIIKREWLRFYHARPIFKETVISWDMAFKDTDGTDYVVGTVWGRAGGDAYLIDLVRRRMGFTDTLAAFRHLTTKYPAAKVKLVEDKANGSAVIDALKHQIPGIIPVLPNGSKQARCYAVSYLFESGNIYIPSPDMKSWVNEYIDELTQFPSAAHDDQVDSTTQALNYLFNKNHGSINTFRIDY